MCLGFVGQVPKLFKPYQAEKLCYHRFGSNGIDIWYSYECCGNGPEILKILVSEKIHTHLDYICMRTNLFINRKIDIIGLNIPCNN